VLSAFNVFSMYFYLPSVLISDQIPSTLSKVRNGLSIKTNVPIYDKLQGRHCIPWSDGRHTWEREMVMRIWE